MKVEAVASSSKITVPSITAPSNGATKKKPQAPQTTTTTTPADKAQAASSKSQTGSKGSEGAAKEASSKHAQSSLLVKRTAVQQAESNPK